MSGHLRARGDKWELRVYVGRDPISGRKKYLTRSVSGGKRDAQRALAQMVAEFGDGAHSALDATVGDLIGRWFDLARPELSPTTVRGYGRNIETYILPALGNVPLARLRPAQLDAFYATLREHGGAQNQGLSPASVRQIHAILRRALQQGARWGWIGTNPAALATPPRTRRTQLEPPSPEDVLQLIATAKRDDPDFGCFLLMSATTGARRGELCGLRWRSVDLVDATVTISRSIVEGERGVLVEKDTKTHSARRIALDPQTAEELATHRSRCAERALACGVSLGEDAYVFSRSPDGTKPLVPTDVTNGFIRVRRQVGLDHVRLHDLRHFAATRLLAAGVPVRTVSGRLGHANAATTLGVYAHFLEASDRDAANTLGAVLQAAQKPSAGASEAKGSGARPIPISRGRSGRTQPSARH